jgi:hypothetical protein
MGTAMMIVTCRLIGNCALAAPMMRSGAIMLRRSNGCTKKRHEEFLREDKRHEVALDGLKA